MLLPMTRYAKVFPVRYVNHTVGIVVYSDLVMYMSSGLCAALASVHGADTYFTKEQLVRASFVQLLAQCAPLAVEVFGVSVFETL